MKLTKAAHNSKRSPGFWRYFNENWEFFIEKEEESLWRIEATPVFWQLKNLEEAVDEQIIKNAFSSRSFLKETRIEGMEFSTRREAIECLDQYLKDAQCHFQFS